jgi:hypothetical protein
MLREKSRLLSKAQDCQAKMQASLASHWHNKNTQQQ